jgi:hypothetical protein
MDAVARGLAGATALVVLSVAPTAAAQDRSAYVPGGLTATTETAHFVLHFDPGISPGEAGMTIQQYAEAGAADFEEAYSRLATGGSGSPNAGLRAPTADADGKTDVYLGAPADKPTFRGGTVYRDRSPWYSAYMFMTPGLGRSGFRFRSAHEFMHVIQNAYTPGYADGLFEGYANWAAEFALPDVDPLDNNFSPASSGDAVPHTWTPLDCSTSTWEGTECGRGYWQWMFIQAQVEDYGPDFVTGYMDRFMATIGTSDRSAPPLLDAEIKAQSGNAEDLRTRYARYALDVWDPTRWTTGSIRTLHGRETRPASYFYTVADPDSGFQDVAIDHLAARYVEVFNYLEGARPGDLVEFSWQRPDGMAAPVVPLVKPVGQEGWAESGSYPGTQGSAQLDFGPNVERVVLPLVNDSRNADDQPFTYRMRLILAPDSEGPDTRIYDHPPKRTAKRRAAFYFEAAEDATFECRVDRSAFKPCRSPKSVRVRFGKHRFEVRATDTAGNVEAKPAAFRWRVIRPRV